MKVSTAIIIIGISFLSSLQRERAFKTIKLGHNYPETLNGKVKQLIEINFINAEPAPCPYDTSNFDRNGNPIEEHSGTGYKGHTCSVTKYSEKYNKGGLKIATIASVGQDIVTYKYGDNGKIVESISGNDQHFYLYNSRNNLIGSILSSAFKPKRMIPEKKYKYSDREYLIEEDIYRGNAKPIIKINYTYLIFDKKGNWLKRISVYNDIHHRKSTDTVQRKISYY